MTKWKTYDLDFKRRAVEQMGGSKDITALAGELKISRGTLYVWKRQLEGQPERRRADLSVSSQTKVERKLREENRLLKEALGQKALEADFFAAALRRVKGPHRSSAAGGAKRSMPKSGVGPSERKAK